MTRKSNPSSPRKAVKLIKKRPLESEQQVRGLYRDYDETTELWECGQCHTVLLRHTKSDLRNRFKIHSVWCDSCECWSVFLTAPAKDDKGNYVRPLPTTFTYVDLGKKKPKR